MISVAVTCLAWYDEDHRFAVGYSDGQLAFCSRDTFDPEPTFVLEAHEVQTKSNNFLICLQFKDAYFLFLFNEPLPKYLL